MNTESGLIIEQKQSLKLSPAQLQTLEILQLSSVDLEQKIRDELMENPALEADESQYDTGHTGTSSRMHGSEGVADFEKYYTSDDTLVDHLMKQLHATKCASNVRRACRFVIYSIDENGYLDMDAEELEAASENTAEEFRQAVPIVQSFDPPGIAARNLEECLLMQLDQDDELSEDAAKVIRILNDIASGKIRSISREIGVSQERAVRIMELIKTLDPKPGARYSSGQPQKYIRPDVIAEVDHGEVRIYMAGTLPQLNVSPYYTELAASSKDEEVRSYLKDRIGRAAGLIRNIENRSNTIVSVAGSILKHQSQFLSAGDHNVNPLTMQEVADELGFNVSTISRAVSDKYLKCPAGTYPLRHFFTAEVAGGTRGSILDRIRELIGSEDPAHPLSDQKIADILTAEDIDISRRTVAKYRDEAGILPTSMRRKRY